MVGSTELTHAFFSRIGFLFLVFSVVTSGSLTDIFSCQMRRMLVESRVFRHILGVLMIFVFIMLEGGWSFNLEEEKRSDNNWATGPVLHSIVIAAGLYSIFWLSSKAQFIPNMIFFGTLLVLYMLNTQRSYWYERQMITEERNKQILTIEYGVAAIAAVVLLYGVTDYVLYQKREYGSQFRWVTFLAGALPCAALKKLKGA